MAMSQFFERLRRQVSFHFNESSAEVHEPQASGSISEEQVGEEDGFLLYGQTRTERNSVTASTCPNDIDSPPPYDQVSESRELPSYKHVMNNHQCIISEPSCSGADNSIALFHNHQKSPIWDIPFQLHPSLTLKHDIQNSLHNLDLETTSFNWSKYSHNFSFEKLCLRDLSSGEEVNIDDIHCSQQSVDRTHTVMDDTANFLRF